MQCDERGPPCANCQIRNLDCDFESPSDFDAIPGRSQSDTGNLPAVGSKRLELELLHYWTAETYRSIVFKDGDGVLWQTTIPRAAFEHDYLLYSILAMSSLHISSISPSSLSDHYRTAALEYQNLAITAFGMEQRRVAQDNSPTIFAFSAINLVLAIAFPSCQVQESQSSIIASFNTVLGLLKGTASIFTSSRTWLSSGPFEGFVRRATDLQHQSLDSDTKSAFDQLRTLRDEDYALRLGSTEGRADAVYLFECITEAIESLERSFGLGGDHGQIVPFSWLVNLQLGCIDAIARLEPLAMLVIMYWATLLDPLGRDRWWARLAGKRLVAETASILLDSRPGWLPAIVWAHKRVGLPPPVMKQV